MEDKLIKSIKICPCLYDKAVKEYRNKSIREKAWSSISASMGVTVKQCQNRWRSLRDRYLKQLLLEKSKSADKCSKWRYMKAMSFLKRHVAPRKTSMNMMGESVEKDVENNSSFLTVNTPKFEYAGYDYDEESALSDNIIEETVTPDIQVEPGIRKASKRLKIEEASERFDVLCGAVTDFIVSKKEKSRNAEFLQVLDGYLKKHSEEEQDRLKIEILNLVYAPNN